MAHAEALFCLGQNSLHGVAAFHFPCLTERAWTKRELADEFNATDAMLDTVQVYGGLLVLRKTRFAIRFVDEWLAWARRGSLIMDTHRRKRQYDGFQAHRHDQSILSLLLKRHMVKTFPFPTKEHDVRDIWGWDAGYCKPGFSWPLPEYRPTYYYGYILHYKEMGHQRYVMRDCEIRQPRFAKLPLPECALYSRKRAVISCCRVEHMRRARPCLHTRSVAHLRLTWASRPRTFALRTILLVASFPASHAASHGSCGSYLDGEAELHLLRIEQRVEAVFTSFRKRKNWNGAKMANLPRLPRPVELIEAPTDVRARCVANVTFGGVLFEGTPLLWIDDGCWGIFQCDDIPLKCGRSWPRSGFELCICLETNGLAARNTTGY